MSFYIGLMSGTSMDGIDAALVSMPDNTLVHGLTRKYSAALKQDIIHLLENKTTSLAALCQINTLIGREFAAAVNELLDVAGVSPRDIEAIGSHGQTVCHDTSVTIPYTLQLGCAHTISSRTGIKVIADFRTRDLINGGQGAPFAPLYHQELFGKNKVSSALVNIGGISNITLIKPNQPAQGWDVGPGNCLMDAWITRHQGMSFDAEGAWAAQGTVIKPLLDALLSDPFFALAAPKSIGKEYFSLCWLESYFQQEHAPVDVQATLLALTAHCIADSYHKHQTPDMQHMYLCGGGAHNLHLKVALADLLPIVHVKSTATLGVSPDFLEAMMFAWLACCTDNNLPVDLSAITGSRTPQILGAIYPILY